MCSDVFGRQSNECFSSRLHICGIKILHIVSEKIVGTFLTFINDFHEKDVQGICYYSMNEPLVIWQLSMGKRPVSIVCD